MISNVLAWLQSTGLVRQVFRLLDQACRDFRPVPWVLLENVGDKFYSCVVTGVTTLLSQQCYLATAFWLVEVLALSGVVAPAVLHQVEALLDRNRAENQKPAVQQIVATLESLGYRSWASGVLCG